MMMLAIALVLLIYELGSTQAYLPHRGKWGTANRLKGLEEVRHRAGLAQSSDDAAGGPVFNDILEQQFLELTVGEKNEKALRWESFFAWEEVQALLSEKVCGQGDIEDIWSGVAGSVDASIDYDKFVSISAKLDSFFEVMENDAEGSFVEAMVESIEYQNAIPEGNVWSLEFQATDALEPEFLAYLSAFFKDKMGGKSTGKLSYDDFANWEDVKSMMEEGEVDEACLKDLWAEACVKQSSLENTEISKELGLDAFIRLNIRLDQTLDEIAEALDTLTDDDVTDYYKGVFESTTGGIDGLMSKQQLMQWAEGELKDVITESQLEALWAALPKKGAEIDVASFLAFNTAVEDIDGSEMM